MCMIDDSERYEPDIDRWQTARKPYQCDECLRSIDVGERYHRGGGAICGDWYTHFTCEQCGAAREWLRVVCSGWVYEMVREDLHEHFQQGYGIWLGRAVVGMQRKWRRKDGTLMPPMELPDGIERISA